MLRADGSVIPGLYAAGACASNLAQDGKGYCSGTQLGEGSFFGRRAGRHAAREFHRMTGEAATSAWTSAGVASFPVPGEPPPVTVAP